MKSPALCTLSVLCLSDLTQATTTSSDLTPRFVFFNDTGASGPLSNVSIDVMSLSAALLVVAFLILLIPPFATFAAALKRRVSSGGSGHHAAQYR